MSLDLGGRERKEAEFSQNQSFILNTILSSEYCHKDVPVYRMAYSTIAWFIFIIVKLAKSPNTNTANILFPRDLAHKIKCMMARHSTNVKENMSSGTMDMQGILSTMLRVKQSSRVRKVANMDFVRRKRERNMLLFLHKSLF